MDFNVPLNRCDIVLESLWKSGHGEEKPQKVKELTETCSQLELKPFGFFLKSKGTYD